MLTRGPTSKDWRGWLRAESTEPLALALLARWGGGVESFLYHLLAVLLASQHKLRAFGDCGDCVGWWWMMCTINEEQEDGLELSPTCLSVCLCGVRVISISSAATVSRAEYEMQPRYGRVKCRSFTHHSQQHSNGRFKRPTRERCAESLDGEWKTAKKQESVAVSL